MWQSTSDEAAAIRVHYLTDDYGLIECIINADIDQLWIHYSNSVNQDDLRSLLLGTILGCVLRLRQVFCLHASVVDIEGKCVVLMGEKQAGKSTTAAALVKYAHAKLIADDIAVINQEEEKLIVQRGYAGLRLNPIAATHLYGEEAQMFPKVYSNLQKRYVFLGEKKHTDSRVKHLTIDRIYLLDDRSQTSKRPNIQALSESDSMMQLIANSYASYAVFGQNSIAHELNMISQILRKTRVHRIQAPADLNKLPELCEAIVKDCGNLEES
jgi:hypothetical protein